MLNRTLELVPVAAIVVGDRVRKDPGDLTGLMQSISKRGGLIHPISIDDNNGLLAGFRRLCSHKRLGWESIQVLRWHGPITPAVRTLIELEENLWRENLTPEQEHDLIVKYTRLAQEEGATLEEIGNNFPSGKRTKGSLSQHQTVEKYIHHPEVKKALQEKGFRAAYQKTVRVKQRQSDPESLTVKQKIHPHSIICADFAGWAPAYDGPPSNFLHCDFPYGIESDKSGQGATHLGTYEDDPEVFWRLCAMLQKTLDRICEPRAHIIFWYSPKHNRNGEVWKFLNSLPGFEFDDYPLIWVKSDNAGIVPDAQRRPRRVYETAFFGWRGDRMLGPGGTKGNAFSCGTGGEAIHPHEKPEVMLRHFFEMIVDKNTRLLDPTCGSGTAIRAAKDLGAAYALGIEKDAGFAEAAQRALDRKEAGDELLAVAGLAAD